MLPDLLQVIERAADREYRSILGEWTEQGSESIYEYLHTVKPILTSQDAGDSLPTATLLPTATSWSDTVQLEKDEDWFRLEIAEPGAEVTLVLGGNPRADVNLNLRDSDGEIIASKRERNADGALVYRAYLSPGTAYVQIVEPPRSLAVVWDTSGSVSAYINQINRAIMSFASDLKPGRDEVNLIPFSNNPHTLLDQWTGQRDTVLQTLYSYNRRQLKSSNAELAMNVASDELIKQDGVRAILVVTDLQSPGHKLNTQLWNSFAQSRPKIFALAVPTKADDDAPQRIHEQFRDWTTLGAGHLDTLSSESRTSVAFRRAAAWLRRPAGYTLRAGLELTPPEPARLRVTATPTILRSASAIEVILDGSGSMLKRLNGVRRYRIARDALIDLASETIPVGTPFALRIFGQGGAGSCKTALEIPLAPLDPALVKRTVRKFKPVNLAKTPICSFFSRSYE